MHIGQFRFQKVVKKRAIVVHMSWESGVAAGRFTLPDDVQDLALEAGYPVLDHDESIGLAFALGYGVIMAGVTGEELLLSGDATAWPDAWGSLILLQ